MKMFFANYEALKPVLYELNTYSAIDMNVRHKKQERRQTLKLIVANIGLVMMIVLILRQLKHMSNGHRQQQQQPRSINISTLLIDRTDGCQDSEGRYARLVTIIFSKAANIEARNSVRLSWGKKAMTMGFFYFVLGPSYSHEVKQNVELEGGTYEDILQLNTTTKDDDDCVQLKTLATLQWLREHCAQVDYVLRADDDMLVDIHGLDNFLQHHRHKLENTAAVIGDQHTRWRSEPPMEWWWWTNLFYRFWSLPPASENYLDTPYLFTGKAIGTLVELARSTFIECKQQQQRKQCADGAMFTRDTHHANLSLWLYPNLIKFSPINPTTTTSSSNVSSHLLISRARSPEHLIQLTANNHGNN